MILELDCGNTLIKWRLFGGLEGISGVAEDKMELLHSLSQFEIADLQGIRLVSVREPAETQAISMALERTFGRVCRVAQPVEHLGGVSNGYTDCRTLGMDRWLAIVGAYSVASKACLVIDLGTAITADFVTQDGRHLGGFICPGLPLMRKELKSHTGRIRYEQSVLDSDITSLDPGRQTSQAVERGCWWMIRGFVREQCEMADRLLGDGCEIILTGGDAVMVRDSIPRARLAPDLVFTGLAIACPIG